MPLFGSTHLLLIAAIAIVAAILSWLCRTRKSPRRAVRLWLGWTLAANELAWWVFRYSHEGLHVTNLPLQLCDLTVWMSVAACLTANRVIAEFVYFAGVIGSGMAILTPDLWTPWPSYPAIYFFIAHGAVLAVGVVLTFGGIVEVRRGAVWRAFGLVVSYAVIVGAFDAVFGANYMYLCRKPVNPSLLDWLGSWPVYLGSAALATLALFWLLWLPLVKSGDFAHNGR